MTYSIFIGNASPVYPTENNDFQFGWEVETIFHPSAPEWVSQGDLPDISGKSNGRHPGYIQMADFLVTTGLQDLFSGPDDGLIRQHPGIASLSKKHLSVVQAARAKWQHEHPGVIPGWGSDQDPVLARLIWYEWWMNWALETCEFPAVSNS